MHLRLVLLSLATIVLLIVSAAWRGLRPPSLVVPGRDGVILAGVTVWDADGGRRPDRTVVVRGARILSVEPSRADDSPAVRVRHEGAYVLPGLIDMHVHLPPEFAIGQPELFALLFLAHGVTTVRETGWASSTLEAGSLALRRDIREGRIGGPRLFTCGPILDADPPFWPMARVLRSAREARAGVDEVAAAGLDCVKVYHGIGSELLDAIRERATQHGLPLVGHLPESSSWTEARIGEIQHVCHPHCWSLDREAIGHLVAAAVRAGLSHTPTLVVYDQQRSVREYDLQRSTPTARLLPRFWREVIWNPESELGYDAVAPEGRDHYERAHAEMVRMVRLAVRRLHEAGVPLYAGTDAGNPFVVPGASLLQELRLLTEVGMTPSEAWASATASAGSALGEPLLGSVRPGAPADLLVFREDPTRDLDALSTLEAVVADGRYYSKADLDGALERSRAHFDGWLYDSVSMLLARLLTVALAPQP